MGERKGEGKERGREDEGQVRGGKRREGEGPGPPKYFGLEQPLVPRTQSDIATQWTQYTAAAAETVESQEQVLTAGRSVRAARDY